LTASSPQEGARRPRQPLRLYKAGELDREGERWRPGEGESAIRYRYFPPLRELDGPIVDLERAFYEDSSDEGSQ
jgi:hypothetical protein